MPAILNLLEELAPAAKKAFASLAPDAQKLVGLLPKVEERWVPLLKQARGTVKLDNPQWGMLEEVMQPAAAAMRSQRLGISYKQAYWDVMHEALTDQGGMSLPLRETVALGKQGKGLDWIRPQLPASTSPIRYQAQVKEWQTGLEKARMLGNQRQIEHYESKMAQIAPFLEGQKVVKDLPPGLRYGQIGLSPKTRFDYAVGVNSSIVVDKAAADMAGDASTKMLRAWWRGLTGKGGVGGDIGGFPNMGRNKKFQKDMAELFVQSWPLQERYYSLASAMMNASLKGNEKAMAKLRPQLVEALTKLNERRYPVFSKYFDQPDVRIALYREPETKAWVEKLMKPGEKKIADAHRELMLRGRDYAEKLGIPVLDREKEYVTHLVGNLGKLSGVRLDKTTLERMQRVLPRLMKFKERNPGSLQFFPSIHSATEAYIPISARKFAMTEFMNKWKPIIEQDFKHWPHLQEFAEKYVRQYTDKMMDEKFWERTMRQVTAWTYLTKTGLSPAVAFKHLGKIVGHFATSPIDFVRAIPPTVKAGLQLGLQRFGVNPGAEARLIRNFLASRNLYEEFSGLTAPAGKWTSGLVRTIGSTPVNLVEAFERGLAVMMAASKAQRLGMSFKDFHRGVWQFMLDNSFMGKADRFLWLNRPWQQFMAIFSYSPGMVTDRTVKYMIKSLPEKYIVGMKAGVIEEALRRPRDVFGTPYLNHFAKLALTVGALEGYARANDMSIWQLLAVHLPMTRHTPFGPELSPTIPYDLYQTYRKRGGDAEDLSSTLFDFFTAFPALDRMKGYWRGELNRVSGGEPWRHFLGIPKLSEEQKIAERIKAGKGLVPPAPWQRRKADEARQKRLLGPLYPIEHDKKGEPRWAP